MMSMHFLITALGSYGDVHPMIGLGCTLMGRGHRVSLVANPYFADVIRSAGLDLVPAGTPEDYLELVHQPDLWHPVRGQIVAFHHSANKALRPVYDLVVSNYTPGETVFCAHGLDMASRIAAEKLRAPLASVNFAPSAFLRLKPR